MKSYSVKSSAVRAAKAHGYKDGEFVVAQDNLGGWFFDAAPTPEGLAIGAKMKAEREAAEARLQAKAEEVAVSHAQAEHEAEQEGDVRPRFLRQKVDGPIAVGKGKTLEEATADALSQLAARGREKLQIAESKQKTPAVKAVKVRKASAPKSAEPQALRPGSKSALLVEMVLRPGGATKAELLAAVGWGECIPQLKASCARSGVTLVHERGDGKEPGRYIGSR